MGEVFRIVWVKFLARVKSDKSRIAAVELYKAGSGREMSQGGLWRTCQGDNIYRKRRHVRVPLMNHLIRSMALSMFEAGKVSSSSMFCSGHHWRK